MRGPVLATKFGLRVCFWWSTNFFVTGLTVGFDHTTLYRIAQNFDDEKPDEFDEWILNCQSFPHQNFVLRKFRYCHILWVAFTNLSFGRLYQDMEI